ncbi:MAG: type III pantothenate kinase [Oscillospiraceae bacterium]
MILTYDIGNANIVMHCVENGEALCRFVLSSNKERTPDEYAAVMELLAAKKGVRLADAAGAVIASVVPQLTDVLAAAVRFCAGVQPLIVGPGVKTGLNIRMDAPNELGGDLVAAAVGAQGVYPLPCILIDMAAATAVGVLDGKGCYIGGLICTGVATGQTSLSRSASQLPNVSLRAPGKVIGKNTVDGMQSGLIYGAAAMLDGVIDRIEAELGQRAAVVATGDIAAAIIPYCRRDDIVIDHDLVMRGLWNIYKKNRDKA